MAQTIKHTLEEINAATIAQNGGRYRLVCNRRIDGKKCRCYIKEVVIGDTYYWSVYYEIDGKESPAYNSLIDQMYKLAHKTKESLWKAGKKIVLWSY